jgi:FkbM family methyltransferase
LQIGVEKIVFIEPCMAAFSELKRRFEYAQNVKLLNCACGDVFGEAMMYTGDNTINNGQSNSLLKPAKHLDIHHGVDFPDKEKVNVYPIDDLGLVGGPYDFLVMDVQGYEGYVIRGASRLLPQINFIYSEVNRDEVYEKNTLVDELDELLHDFTRVETGPWVGGMWSDALYIRKSLLQ